MKLQLPYTDMLKFTDVLEEGTASGFCSEDRCIEPFQHVDEFLPVNSQLHPGRQKLSATAGGTLNLE
jgi:hypothetical protein